MAKVSLADLRAGNAPVALPERSYPLCLRRDLLAKADKLTRELQALPVGDDEGAPPKRVGEGAPPKVQEIRARLGALYDEMEEATGELGLRAVSDGEWRRWVNEHGPRDGDQRDELVAYGLCNADDLANDLGKWVVSWDGEPFAADDWSRVFAPKVAGGDLKNLVAIAVQLQEAVEDPKLRRLVSLGALTSSADES